MIARCDEDPQEVLLTQNAPHGVVETLMENYNWTESEAKSETASCRVKQTVQHRAGGTLLNYGTT